MSVVIVGGNECMIRRYKDACLEYGCSSVKVFAKPETSLRDKIGNPDLLVLFTGTMSHKMVNSALGANKDSATKIARCRSSSMSALRAVLEEHALCPENF